VGLKLTVVAALAALIVVPPAAGASWFPHPADATWTYEWSDTVYNTTPTKEKITVGERSGRAFRLEWTTLDLDNPPEAPFSVGIMDFEQSTSGLINTNWQSSAPPPGFPVLCAQVTRCGNSLAGTLYLLIWGSRAPVLAEPLLAGTSWAATGGADGDVTSLSQYLGRERIRVPAFPEPVVAAKVRTDVTQAGAIGDPFGSGVRTVWWVYGVGPVKVVFEHAGGSDAPTTTSVLVSTNQEVAAAPPHANWFPLRRDAKVRYRWTNNRHMRTPSVQEFHVAEVARNTARVDVQHLRGPIRVAGSYVFSLRTDGVTNISAFTQAASLARFPALGPRFLPVDRRRRFFTPFDLMVYGMNPIVPAYPAVGNRWAVRSPSRDFSVFGVTGTTRILGMRTVQTPAGRFRALAVQSTVSQAGFPFGSGVRTSYFVGGRGLVKLVFRHRDGSTSVVDRLR
jgi:hypothetical protein